ncbi:MAG: protein kinase [Planctomycetes bacterium]|nr:protein kinase [Planctomycetota bacterium]
MPSPEDLLFGKIAVSYGYCSQAQVDQCLREQDTSTSSVPLGEILLKNQFLSPDQVAEVLKQQKKVLDQTDIDTKKKKREILFGQLLIRKGWATEAQVNEALREQGLADQRGRPRQLGEILVARGIITAEQIQQLLAEQNKSILRCQMCGARYNVAGYEPGKMLRCLKCNEPLVVPRKIESVQTEASIRSDGTTDSLLGRTLGGCRILQELGRGGMATVYRGHHVGLNKDMAVKVLPRESALNREFIERFVTEARAAAKLEHPNIVQVFNVACEEDINFILMQLVDGHSLTDSIQNRKRLPADQAVRIMKEVAKGLGAAHRAGIVHRDVKPDNVLISKNGQVKVADFGLARDVGPARPEAGQGATTPSQAGGEPIMGTPYFMSPEQWQGRGADARSDLYALGATFYYAVTGRPPFEGTSPYTLMKLHTTQIPKPAHHIEKDIPEGVSAIIQKLLQKDPRKRYASTENLIRDLDKVLQDEVPSALEEVGELVVCKFCGTGNPQKSRKCNVCGEFLQEGKSATILLEDEFECPKCHQAQTIGGGRCAKCRALLCTKCHVRLAVADTLCDSCGGAHGRGQLPTRRPSRPL